MEVGRGLPASSQIISAIPARRSLSSIPTVVSVGDLAAIEETLEILADPELVASIRRSLRTQKRYSIADVKARMAKRSPS